MLTLSAVAPAYMPAVQPMAAPRATVVKMETIDDLKEMSTKLNPVVGYWYASGSERTACKNGTAVGFVHI